MAHNRVVADARRFFIKQADIRWGYLTRKKRERTPREQTIFDAKTIYWRGIKRAWEIYTKDNKTVKQANEALDKAIGQAHKLYLKDEDAMPEAAYERAKELFIKAVYKAHDDYAVRVASVWKDFMKDVKKFK